MHISELLEFIRWYETNVINVQIHNLSNQLLTVLNNNVNRPNGQPFQPFSTHKDKLINAILSSKVEELTIEQEKLLEKIGLDGKLGKKGQDFIDGVLFKNNIDIAQAKEEIQRLTNSFSTANNKITQLKNSLTSAFGADDFYDLTDKVLMRIYFYGNRSINNVQDFRDMGDVWYEIGYGITIAHGGSVQDVSIIGAQKGSVIIDIALVAKYAATISGIILAGLKIAEKVADIFKKCAEIKNLGLKNKQIEKQLEAEAEAIKKDGVESIVEETIKKLGIKKKGDGDKVNALTKAVERLVDFTENGGVVDLVPPKGNDNNAGEDSHSPESGSLLEIRKNFLEIRYIEEKLKLIEYNREDHVKESDK